MTRDDQTTNTPKFDPLNPTTEEQADMAAGYIEGWARKPPSRDSIVYAWGRGSAARDRGDEPDSDRLTVEARLRERLRCD